MKRRRNLKVGKNSVSHIFVYGLHSVYSFLNRHPELVLNVFVQDNTDKDLIDDLRLFSKRNKKQFNTVSKKFLDKKAEGGIHQGVGLLVEKFPYMNLEEFLMSIDTEKETHSLVLMQNITDVKNAGAIIRSARLLGASGVLMPNIRQTHSAGALAKTSSGAIFEIPIVTIGNVLNTLKALQKFGFWSAVLDMEGDPIHKADLDRNIVFVLGSEGLGVSEHVIKNADMRLSIDTIKQNTTIDSLNVSVAGGIALYEWRRQKLMRN